MNQTRYVVTTLTRSELAVLCDRHNVTIKRWIEKIKPELETKRGYVRGRHSFTGEAAQFVLYQLGIGADELAAIRPKRKNIQYKLDL